MARYLTAIPICTCVEEGPLRSRGSSGFIDDICSGSGLTTTTCWRTMRSTPRAAASSTTSAAAPTRHRQAVEQRDHDLQQRVNTTTHNQQHAAARLPTPCCPRVFGLKSWTASEEGAVLHPGGSSGSSRVHSNTTRSKKAGKSVQA
jgi:hypothetical protein